MTKGRLRVVPPNRKFNLSMGFFLIQTQLYVHIPPKCGVLRARSTVELQQSSIPPNMDVLQFR